ncbi:MAG: 2-hydroxyacyl-CoA dehydratase, partial [Promethearchaeota archaeon]
MEDIELLTDYAGYLEQKKSEGKKIIAFIAHDNMPEELIHAGGFIPMRLIFAGNDDLMNISHEYLPPSTCCFAQTCIGLFKLELSRYRFLKLIDYFVVSNHCVSDICTSEIITKFFNIPRLNFYISYTASEYSQKYFNLALTDFKKQLEEIKGGVISNTELFESIKIYNEFKIKLSKLNKVLHDDKQKLKIFQKALLYGPEISSELDTLLESSKNTENKPQENKKDIILTGCALFIGD